MDDNFEVYTMLDKTKRDEMFDQFRASEDPWERQVTKFSGVQKQPDGSWASTWSVAVPTGRG